MKALMTWIHARLPIREIWNRHAAEYYAPKNLNFWYYFGVFSIVVFLIQVISGIWLTMHYVPTEEGAFNSIEHIMRHVKYGWLIRYLHTTGGSAFFIVIYFHIYRCLIYGSYQKPRELVWLLGAFIYVLLVAEAFTGYTLPWGQMSYWATKVIASLFQAVPFIGHTIAIWIQGDYSVSGTTLQRFFAFHVTAIPMIITFVILIHIMALHQVGSNNPKGIDEPGGIPFHPYYTVKDFFGVIIFLILFSFVLFFAPGMHGYFLEPANFIPANPMVTPEHISPVWYLSPFYAILRAIPDKLFGAIAMAAAIAILFLLPWLDRSSVRSLRYKGFFSKIALLLFVVAFIGLGVLGTLPSVGIYVWLARVFTVIYFAFFVLMPLYTQLEKTDPPPKRARGRK